MGIFGDSLVGLAASWVIWHGMMVSWVLCLYLGMVWKRGGEARGRFVSLFLVFFGFFLKINR